MENKQMDKRQQRKDDKSNQKTTNGFKNSAKDQQQPNANTHSSKAGLDWNPENQSTESGRSDQDKPGSEAYQSQYSKRGSSETRSDHTSRPQQTQKNQSAKDHGKWEGQGMNHKRETESAGVIDEDRGLFQDEEMDHPSRQRSQGESIDTENSNIDSPEKNNQVPPSKFS